ncbi:MAG: prepilin-type N-terminal cleavage/methylation domain-containing protein [Sedimentisphaerales bacterium]|nr:prepilin-type N-terminal cleavage/methylation domain-containing protein [Sedimentisphaerales bacterium]
MKGKAFTLIELLVVIAIIGLLISIIAPSLRKAKESVNLMRCGNNQHQALTGLSAYSIDHNGSLPPHPAERIDGSYSVINYINYHQGSDAQQNAKNQGLYYYLGDYLPLVDVFMCPLGRTKDYSELQRQYMDYTTSGEGTVCSYNLYWGGLRFTTSEGQVFEGPRGREDSKKVAGLLLSDSIFNWPPVAEDWWLAHRPRKGTGQFKNYDWDPVYGNYCASFWIYNPNSASLPADGELPIETAELRMNAGYIDGSVRRYTGKEVKWTSNQMYYIPYVWR